MMMKCLKWSKFWIQMALQPCDLGLPPVHIWGVRWQREQLQDRWPQEVDWETWQSNFWNTARDCLAACGGTVDCLAPPDAGPCDGRSGHLETIVNICTSPDLLNQVNSILLGPSTGGLRDFWVRRLCREHQQLLVVGPVQRQLPGLGGEEYWKTWIWSFNGGGTIGGSQPL